MKKIGLILLALLLAAPLAFAAYETGFNHDVQYVDTFAQKVEVLPGQLQTLLDYAGRSDGQPVYKGNAVLGTATSASSWVIYKYTYTADPGNMLTKKTAYGIWDNRTSLTYA